ncbi:hypothetical protein [Flavobacterium sp.]|uniref:hypothetical protein n=1 Tax=Flavobacterium sp. TaxID=239 RepID=UPI00404856F8
MSKLSLDALKERAENLQSEEVMNKIEGGGWSDCHGFWGGIGKAWRADKKENGPDSIGFSWD